MLGLIIKDILNLKKSFRIYGLVTIIYGAISFISKESSFFNTIFSVLFATLIFSIYSYDEMAKWDTYALTLPISRKNIVKSKYLVMLLIDLIGVLICVIYNIILNIVLKTNTPFAGMSSIWIGIAIVLLFYSITIPFITKLGVEKSRLIVIIVYLVPFIIYYVLGIALKDGTANLPHSLLNLWELFLKNIYLIVPITILLAIYISYQISVAIYIKKEF